MQLAVVALERPARPTRPRLALKRPINCHRAQSCEPATSRPKVLLDYRPLGAVCPLIGALLRDLEHAG
eukprot:4590362-Pyramimonas_sp.AAC.1